MFTGLVEATGTVQKVTDLGDQARLDLTIPFAGELSLGESVAVNGCCLTVADLYEGGARFDVLKQTLEVTALGDFKEGRLINLERALAMGDRLGGHLVQGHVDGVGEIVRFEEEGQDHVLEVSLAPSLQRYCLDKGSITLDGMSLTIGELQEDRVVSYITPHTFEVTNLSQAQVGNRVNVESDLMAKYVERLFPERP